MAIMSNDTALTVVASAKTSPKIEAEQNITESERVTIQGDHFTKQEAIHATPALIIVAMLMQEGILAPLDEPSYYGDSKGQRGEWLMPAIHTIARCLQRIDERQKIIDTAPMFPF